MMEAKETGKQQVIKKGEVAEVPLKAKTKLADNPFPRPLCSLPLASKDNT